MSITNLLTNISRDEEYPKFIQVSSVNNCGYISISINNWTDKMFYELPVIQFNVYVKQDNEYIKYTNNSIIMETYIPDITEGITRISKFINNIPNECYICITPLFDIDAITSRNYLIYNGIESGDIWEGTTNSFDIDINFLTDL